MSDIKQKVTDSRKKMEELREQLKKDSKILFKNGSKDLFRDYPELKMFGWRQYTPYFNDGESCEFSADLDCPIVNWVDDNYGEVSDEDKAEEFFGTCDYDELSKRFEPLTDKVKEFLNLFDVKILLDMFGDHAEIIVTPEGVEVEEYEHD